MLQSDEAPGETQETLIRLFFLAGLGTSWCPSQRAGGGKYLGGKAWLSNCCPTELDLVNLLFL